MGVEKVKIPKVHCPKCKKHVRIEEVMDYVVQVSLVDAVEDGAVDYGATSHEGGLVDHYQCAECGSVIKDTNGFIIDQPEDLEEHIRKFGILEGVE